MMDHELKLLITDDEDGMRYGAQRALERFSTSFQDLDAKVTFHVETAASGEEALEKLKENRFDILLLDYKLPGLNGIEVLGAAKEIDPELMVIMMTAYASLETAVMATKKGAFDFLAKPFTPEELRAAVRGATKSSILHAQAKRMAEEKRRMRFEFISVLSHELKSPIGAVEGYLDLIRSGSVKDDETLKRVIERSMARLGGMRKLIFDLLDLTRIEAGTKVRKFEMVDLSAVVRASIELVEVQAADRGITMSFSPIGETVINADRGELDIVVNNLVSNAVKYNRDKGKVLVNIDSDDSMVTLSVADTGIGMTPEEAGRLFGEFVRIKNAKTRNIEGSGLGLSTVKKIAQLYGGDVWVESVPDVGSTFKVTFKNDTAVAN